MTIAPGTTPTIARVSDEIATPRAVLFDVDGTLVDTNYLHTLAWSRALRDIGEWAPMNAIHRLIGMGADQLVPRLIGRDVEAVPGLRGDRFKELIGESVAFPGAADLIALLHDQGVLVVLATSSSSDDLDHMIGLLGVAHLIDHVVCGDDLERSKPDPQVFVQALGKAGVSAGHAVVIGDSVWDIAAADTAGLRCIAVESGGFGRAELDGATAVCRDVQEIADRVRAGGLLDLLDDGRR